MKRWFYIAASLVTAILVVAGARLAQRESTDPVSVAVSVSPPMEAGSPVIAPAKEAKAFPAAAQDEIQKCLGASAGDFGRLETLVAATVGNPERDQLEWKTVQFEDRAGKIFRLRLSRDFTESGKAELNLSLFAVDEEGMPERIPLPTQESRQPDLEAMNRVLHDKRVSNEIESTRYFYANERELVLERENGVVQKLQYMGGNIRLACEATSTAPSCHCVR